MKILKVGRVEPETYKFECPECGCIFEADPEEVRWPEDGLDPRFAMGVTCPCCCTGIFVHKPNYKGKVPANEEREIYGHYSETDEDGEIYGHSDMY